MKLKQNEDFDFCIGSALYKMQQRLTVVRRIALHVTDRFLTGIWNDIHDDYKEMIFLRVG